MLIRFEGIYKKSNRKSKQPNLHHFCISTDYPDIDRIEDGFVPAEAYMFPLPEDTVIQVEGEWDSENNILMASKVVPSTENEALSLKMIKNIISDIKRVHKEIKFSTRIPKQIIEITGKDILQYAKLHDNCSDICEKLPKIDPKKIEMIYKKLRESITSYEVIPYLESFGISAFTGEKIARKYGPSAIKRIKRHPYMIGIEFGIPFIECDRIAEAEKINALSDERISAMSEYVLRTIAEGDGSTYATYPELMENIERIRKKSSFPDIAIPHVLLYIVLENNKKFVLDNADEEIRVSLSYYKKMELKCIKHLKRLENGKTDEKFPDQLIEDLEKKLSISYGEQQKEALRLAGDKGVLIVTGGPGTGKTTTMRGFVELYKTLNPKGKIALCAPTGRAAQRMSDVIKGVKAQTVHKLLEIKLFDTEMIYKNEYDPICADLIIVDEASMLDIEIFSKLLPAIKSGSTLLLVGDEDQLKSVGAGNVIHDMLSCKKFRTVRLNKGYRQENTSSIVKNAHKILNNEFDLIEDDDFQIIKYKTESEAQKKIITAFQSNFSFSNPMSTQILSDIKKYDLGTVMLNHKIKESYKSKMLLGKRIEKGDKVILTRNNYDAGYFNGDIGIVTEVFPTMLHININGNIIDVEREDLQDVQLAYAITIHKSQGSEYETAIIVMPEKPKNMLTKNLIYTAVTRAKKKVILITTDKALETAIKTEPIMKVKTNLANLLQNI